MKIIDKDTNWKCSCGGDIVITTTTEIIGESITTNNDIKCSNKTCSNIIVKGWEDIELNCFLDSYTHRNSEELLHSGLSYNEFFISEKYIKPILTEDVIYNVGCIEDCVEIIMDLYIDDDVSMVDVLASVGIVGFSAEDVVDIYAKCKYLADKDLMVMFYDETTKDNVNEFSDNCMILGE